MDHDHQLPHGRPSTISRRLEWDAGHRVPGHGGHCFNIHGHRYAAEVHAYADELDALDMVVDFGVLKAKVGTWIQDHWDHAFIAWERDYKILRAWVGDYADAGGIGELLREKGRSFPGLPDTFFEGHQLFLLPGRPTAEIMAAYLLERVCPVILEDEPVRVVRVELWETPNCRAIAAVTLGDDQVTLGDDHQVPPLRTSELDLGGVKLTAARSDR